MSEYQLTANVWARALLEDEFGVKPSDIHWVRGGLEEPGRLEKIPIKLPPDVRLEDAPARCHPLGHAGRGTIDAFIGPRIPSCFERGHPNVGWLFPDPTAAASDYFARTGIFPIMHIVGVRRSLVDQHPWLPAAVLKAFEQAKAMALARLRDTSATKVTHAVRRGAVEERARPDGAGLLVLRRAANRKVLDTFLHHHHAQGLSSRRLAVDELFHPTTFESFKL